MNERYFFPAIVDAAENGFLIKFPDFSGCFAFGHTEKEALEQAKQALIINLSDMKHNPNLIPKSANIRDIELEENQYVVVIEA